MSNIISPAKVDMTRCNGLAIYKGGCWTVPVTIFTRDNLTDTPVDLSGYTGTCVIKKHTGDDTPIAMPEVQISTETAGLFTLCLSSSLSQNIPTTGKTFANYSTYVYEVNFKDTISQESYRALYGSVDVIPAVQDSDDEN